MWSAIAACLPGAPPSLTQGTAAWTDPDLLLAQTCGYPLVTSLKDRVTLVATPRYRAEGCGGANYRSVVIVRRADTMRRLADLRSRICAVNDIDSNSGMNLLRAAVAPFARGVAHFFSAVIITGSHAASVRAVADHTADVAAIDCVTWAHLRRLRPADTGGLRVVAWTASTPGLPLITSAQTDAATQAALWRALQHVAQDPALGSVRDELLLDGFAPPDLRAYDTILDLEHAAQDAGYPHLT